MNILIFVKEALKAVCPYGIIKLRKALQTKNIKGYCAFKRLISDPENSSKYLLLINKLIEKEKKYGGFITNVK
jgi:hypothetical protein